MLVSTSSYNPHPEFHNFAHPAQKVSLNKEEKLAGRFSGEKGTPSNALRYFAMLVYKSEFERGRCHGCMASQLTFLLLDGSLARENVRDEYCEGSWDKFNAAVEAVQDDLPPKQIGFYWYRPDIIPSGAHKLHRYVRNGSDDTQAASAEEVETFKNPTDNAAAILHSQFLNYRHRSSNILTSEGKSSSSSSQEEPPSLKRIFAVGGAAANPVIVQTLSDVLGCDVCKPVVELDDEDDVPASEPGSPDAGTPNGNGNGKTSPSSGSGSESKRKTRNADFNSCSVAAAYKAKWAYVRFYNAKQRQETSLRMHQQQGNGSAGQHDITFEDMVNNSKAIRRLRRAVTRQLRITNVPAAQAENGASSTTNGTTVSSTSNGSTQQKPRSPKRTLTEPAVRAAAVKSAQEEAEQHDEGVAVVASPRHERTEAFVKSVTWWKGLEERAVSSSRSGEGYAK